MKGGDKPTVCDANVVLGYLPSDVKLGGAMDHQPRCRRDGRADAGRCDGHRTHGSRRGHHQDRQRIDARRAATRVGRAGLRPARLRARRLSVAPGPLHANALGILSGAWPVIVPPGPGVLCAYGDATTQVQDEASQTYVARVDEIYGRRISSASSTTLRARASESFEADGIPADQQEATYQADIRYAGAGLPAIPRCHDRRAERSKGLAVLTDEFDRQHEQLFTFAHGKDHEIVMIRAIVKAKSSLDGRPERRSATPRRISRTRSFTTPSSTTSRSGTTP